MARILYLSFDGLADPLGKSQIIPYLLRCNNRHLFHIYTLEKKQQLAKNKKIIKKIKTHFHWKYNFFLETRNIFYKIFFYFIIFFKILFYKKNFIFHCIHCRGFLPSIIGYFIFKLTKIKYIFDMRSLWIDERIESDSFKKNFFNKILIFFLKILEEKIIKNSFYVVVLTNKLKFFLKKKYNIKNISVIPCSTVFKKKNIINNKFKKKTICYLGSIGKMYLLDQVLDFFEILNNKKEYQLKLIVNQKKIAKKMLKKKIQD